MRYLGLDYGSTTVGIAISDELNLMAHPMETIFRERATKLRRTLSRIKEICVENKITHIILGYPLMISGDERERCEATLEFKKLLENRLVELGIEIILLDERYTTFEANEILEEIKVKPSERKKLIDKIAAGLILQDYLNKEQNGR